MLRDVLLILLANLIFFFKPLFIDRLAFATSEFLTESFGFFRYMGDMLRSGSFPLWDPYCYNPYAALNFPAVFYPFNIIGGYISSFLNFDATFYLMELIVILHFFISGVSMYLLLRQFNIKREGALLGSIAYCYNTFVSYCVLNTYTTYTATWLPLIILLFLKGIIGSSHNNRNFILSGVFLALSILGGNIGIALYIFMMLFFCSIWFVVRNRNISSLRGVIITFSVAICLAAVQFFPTYEYFSLSVRKGIGYDLITEWGSTPAFHFINFLIPHFFGGAGGPDWAWQVLGVGFYVFFYYIGVSIVFLAILGIFVKIKKKTLRDVYIFMFFAVLLTLFLIMGKHNAVFGWLYSLPIVPVSRIPARWALFLDFFLACLSAIAFSALLDPLSKITKKNLQDLFRKVFRPLAIWLPVIFIPIFLSLIRMQHKETLLRTVYFFVFFYSFILFVSFRIRGKFKKKYALVFVAIVFIDLYLANGLVIPFKPAIPPSVSPEKVFKQNDVISLLRKDPDIFRVSGLSYPVNTGQACQIYTLGYMGGFHYVRLGDFRGQDNPQGTGSFSWFDLKDNPLAQTIDFYNIKYFFTPIDLERLYPQKFERASGILNLYRNKKVLPRAFVVSQYEIMPDTKEMLRRMEEIDLSNKAILEENPGFESNTEGNCGTLKISSYRPQEIDMEANINKDALLVLSDVFYPGWHAFVDGRRVKILRANYVFRAIRLPRGEHKIHFVFLPLSVIAGLFVSCISVVILVFYFLKQRKRRKVAYF